MVAVEDYIIVGGRVVVAERDAALVCPINVAETEAAVGDDALELIAEVLGLVAYLI